VCAVIYNVDEYHCGKTRVWRLMVVLSICFDLSKLMYVNLLDVIKTV